MPAVHAYAPRPLAALVTVTASGVAVHLRDRGTTEAVCDLRLSRAELRELLERADVLASLDETAESPALADHTIQGGS